MFNFESWLLELVWNLLIIVGFMFVIAFGFCSLGLAYRLRGWRFSVATRFCWFSRQVFHVVFACFCDRVCGILFVVLGWVELNFGFIV